MNMREGFCVGAHGLAAWLGTDFRAPNPTVFFTTHRRNKGQLLFTL